VFGSKILTGAERLPLSPGPAGGINTHLQGIIDRPAHPEKPQCCNLKPGKGITALAQKRKNRSIMGDQRRREVPDDLKEVKFDEDRSQTVLKKEENIRGGTCLAK